MAGAYFLFLFLIYFVSYWTWYLSVPPTRQDLTQGLFLERGFRRGGVIHEPRLLCCWSMLVISSLGAMWTMLTFAKSPGTKTGDFASHRFTRPGGLGQCESMLSLFGLMSHMPGSPGLDQNSKLMLTIRVLSYWARWAVEEAQSDKLVRHIKP